MIRYRILHIPSALFVTDSSEDYLEYSQPPNLAAELGMFEHYSVYSNSVKMLYWDTPKLITKPTFNPLDYIHEFIITSVEVASQYRLYTSRGARVYLSDNNIFRSIFSDISELKSALNHEGNLEPGLVRLNKPWLRLYVVNGRLPYVSPLSMPLELELVEYRD